MSLTKRQRLVDESSQSLLFCVRKKQALFFGEVNRRNTTRVLSAKERQKN